MIATPEKALIDSLYLASRKGNRFGSFPELDLTALSFEDAEEWLQRIPYERIRTHVTRRFEEIFEGGHPAA